MNSEDIYDGITDIRDDQINGAEKFPKGRKPKFAGWFVAAAALLAVVVTSAALFKPDGKLPVKFFLLHFYLLLSGILYIQHISDN